MNKQIANKQMNVIVDTRNELSISVIIVHRLSSFITPEGSKISHKNTKYTHKI